jgi:hypothetical protein
MEAGLVQVNHSSVAQQGAADRHTRLLPTVDGSAR